LYIAAADGASEAGASDAGAADEAAGAADDAAGADEAAPLEHALAMSAMAARLINAERADRLVIRSLLLLRDDAPTWSRRRTVRSP
jgi:hypothetical protein